jgi:CelD/BcsL family acetyltransferase involved in cellulose biosynthesis
LLAALRRFDPKGEVAILRFESGGEMLGLMPLAQRRRYARWPFPHLAGWIHANCFVGAPLVARGCETAFWQALLHWADAHAGTSLFLHLSHLPVDTALTVSLLETCRSERRRAEVVHREERALLSSNLPPDAYLERALPGKKRKELRRQHARLSELGSLAVVRDRDTHGLAAWVDRFLALEQAGWKGSAGSALACSEATELMAREALAEAGRRGKLERLSLELDGRPIAMLATFLSGRGAFSWKTAYDEGFARFSPGVLLQRENLSLLERADIDWCDSCAAPDHPMIDSLWTERRAIGRVSIAIGGSARRAAFDRLVDLELARSPTGVSQ